MNTPSQEAVKEELKSRIIDKSLEVLKNHGMEEANARDLLQEKFSSRKDREEKARS